MAYTGLRIYYKLWYVEQGVYSKGDIFQCWYIAMEINKLK